MLDKAKLGARYTCFECGTKFYDLNRGRGICPECGADQENAPVRDIKSLLSSGRKPKAETPDPKLKVDDSDDGDDGGDDDDDDLFDDADGDDDDLDDDDDDE